MASDDGNDERRAAEAEDAKSRLRRGLRRSHRLVERYREKLSGRREPDGGKTGKPKPIFFRSDR